MKSIKYILSGILLLIATCVNSQTVYYNFSFLIGATLHTVNNATYTTSAVTTPNNSSVTVLRWTNNDWSSSTKTAIRGYWEGRHSGITFLSEATVKYNCHAWAWDNGNTWDWMNQQPYDYWNDDSYILLPSSTGATKVWYGASADHSAITTSTTNVVTSKWGIMGPRFTHNINNSPYLTTDLSYYVLGIDGPKDIYYSNASYTSASYTLNSALATGTVNWSVSPIGSFSVSSSTGTSTKIVKNSSASSGTVTLTATVGSKTYTKKITAYYVDMDGPVIVYGPYTVGYTLPIITGATYYWESRNDFLQLTSANGVASVSFHAPYTLLPVKDVVECTVTINGIQTCFSKNVTIY